MRVHIVCMYVLKHNPYPYGVKPYPLSHALDSTTSLTASMNVGVNVGMNVGKSLC